MYTRKFLAVFTALALLIAALLLSTSPAQTPTATPQTATDTVSTKDLQAHKHAPGEMLTHVHGAKNEYQPVQAAASRRATASSDVLPTDPFPPYTLYSIPETPLKCTTTGKAVKVLYVYPEGGLNRVSTVRTRIQKIMRHTNSVFSISSGNKQSLRVVTNSTCNASVSAVAIPRTVLDGSGTLSVVLANRGYKDPSRKYLSFVDYNTICGTGNIYADASPYGSNLNNTETGYARVDFNCWIAEKAGHEIAHMLGAVQPTAPNGSAKYHCGDDYDIMCYNDGSVTTTIVCPDDRMEAQLDCGRQDYFSMAPAPGSWLDTHWNIAASSFLYGKLPY